jgi:hypothetical protein
MGSDLPMNIMDRLMDHLYNWFYDLGFKMSLKYLLKKYIVIIDEDNIVDIERIDDTTIVIKLICIPCEHDPVKQQELREMIKP